MEPQQRRPVYVEGSQTLPNRGRGRSLTDFRMARQPSRLSQPPTSLSPNNLVPQEAIYESLYDSRWRLLAMEASRLPPSPTPTASSSSRESSLDPFTSHHSPVPQLPLVLSTRSPRQLLLRRPHNNVGFGFTLRHFIVYPPEGELSTSGRRGSLCGAVDTIFVRSVKPNGAAFVGGLRVGDRLVRVNDETVSNLTYGQVVARVKEASHVLHLMVVPQEDDMLQRYFSEMARNPESNVKPTESSMGQLPMSTSIYPQDMAESPAMQRMKREVALKEAFLMNEHITPQQQRVLPPIPVEAEVHAQPDDEDKKSRQEHQQMHVYQSLNDGVEETSQTSARRRESTVFDDRRNKSSSSFGAQVMGCSEELSSVSTSRKSSFSRKKSSISSSFFPPKQYAVTLVVNESEKTKLVDMLHRAKSVITKKMDKVMGRKHRGGDASVAAVSSADALTSILQSWVNEEEAKQKEDDKELKQLMQQQRMQLECMMKTTGNIVSATIDDDHNEEDDVGDEVALKLVENNADDDLNVQELVMGDDDEKDEEYKNCTQVDKSKRCEASVVLRLPAKVVHRRREEVYRRSLTPCESVPRHFAHISESEMYPKLLRRPSSLYDERAHNASSRPLSRQACNEDVQQDDEEEQNIDAFVLAPSSLPHIQRPESNTVPVGGVWRPQQGDELDPYNRSNIQRAPDYPPSGQAAQQLQRQRPLQQQQRRGQLRQERATSGDKGLWSASDRNLRRISYLQATQPTSEDVNVKGGDEKNDVDVADEARSFTDVQDEADAKRGLKKTQGQSSERSAASIQRIRALFGERMNNGNNNNTNNNNANTVNNSLSPVCVDGEDSKQGWLYCKVAAIDGKKAPGRSWKPVFVVLRPKAILIFRDKKSAFEQPGVYEELPVSLAESHVSVADDYTKRKNVFRVVTNSGSEYLFQAEDDTAMHEWVSAIDVSVRVLIDERLSKHRNSSASNSPATKARKSSTDHGGSPKKTWKGKMAKQLKKIHSSSSPATSSFASESGSLGVSIEDCPMSPSDPGVPWLVSHCVRMVEQRGLEVVGLYRVPGNSASVSLLSDLVNTRSPEDAFKVEDETSKWNDVNVVSSLLKAFFRKLPEPIFTADLYQEFIEASKIDDIRYRMERLRCLVHMLPSSHFSTLHFLVLHLKSVAAHSSVNKMETRNLAIVFGPTLVRPSDNNMMAMVTDMAHQCRIVEALLTHTTFFFDTNEDHQFSMESNEETKEGKGVLEAWSEPNLSLGVSSKEDSSSETATKESLLLTNLQKLEDAGKIVSAKEVVSGVISAANRKMGNNRGNNHDFNKAKDNSENKDNDSNCKLDSEELANRRGSNSGALRLIQPDRGSPKRYPVQDGSEIDGGILVEEPYSTEAYMKEEAFSHNNFVNLNYLMPSKMSKSEKNNDSEKNNEEKRRSLSTNTSAFKDKKSVGVSDNDEDSDASDCSDILTSITATFDEKLRLLLDPTYQQQTTSSSSSSSPPTQNSLSGMKGRRSHGGCELRRGRVVDKHRMPPLLRQGPKRKSGHIVGLLSKDGKTSKDCALSSSIRCRRQSLRRHTMPNIDLNLVAIIEETSKKGDREERRKSSTADIVMRQAHEEDNEYNDAHKEDSDGDKDRKTRSSVLLETKV